jgi:3' exoribonuclease, RNase T-like
MRWFFDTEFNDTGREIQLISIGMISDDGRKSYAACLSDGWHEKDCDAWMKKNVLPHLPSKEDRKLRVQVVREIVDLVGPEPEFWAYHSSYDWVALCQLVTLNGRLLDLPKGWPRFCCDLKLLMHLMGVDKKILCIDQEKTTKHDALEDARWNRRAWLGLQLLPFPAR